jgi:glutathione peroxidase
MFYNFTMNDLNGNKVPFQQFEGRVVLMVNVASQCGLTPQYKGLEELYRQFKDVGFLIVGVPANNFGAQEPGSHDEIKSFCEKNFGVSFLMLEKISVNGDDRHPLYNFLTKEQPLAFSANGDTFEKKLNSYGIQRKNTSDVLWNFEKFLISKNGKVLRRFSPDTEPNSPDLVQEIKQACH